MRFNKHQRLIMETVVTLVVVTLVVGLFGYIGVQISIYVSGGPAPAPRTPTEAQVAQVPTESGGLGMVITPTPPVQRPVCMFQTGALAEIVVYAQPDTGSRMLLTLDGVTRVVVTGYYTAGDQPWSHVEFTHDGVTHDGWIALDVTTEAANCF